LVEGKIDFSLLLLHESKHTLPFMAFRKLINSVKSDHNWFWKVWCGSNSNI